MNLMKGRFRWSHPALGHNVMQERISTELMTFVASHPLGRVVRGLDFRLAHNFVRNTDVAFIAIDHRASNLISRR